MEQERAGGARSPEQRRRRRGNEDVERRRGQRSGEVRELARVDGGDESEGMGFVRTLFSASTKIERERERGLRV